MPDASGKPLVEKLGIKAGFKVLVVAAPENYRSLLRPLPDGVRLHRSGKGPFDVIHVFSTRAEALETALPRFVEMMPDGGMIWASWPKRSSGQATDLDENAVRELALGLGLVDVKVCSVDETWSGLKLVRRVKARQPPRRCG